jgi:hypothetical protein
MNLNVAGFEDERKILLAQRGPPVLNTALQVWIPQSAGNFLTKVGS